MTIDECADAIARIFRNNLLCGQDEGEVGLDLPEIHGPLLTQLTALIRIETDRCAVLANRLADQWRETQIDAFVGSYVKELFRTSPGKVGG